MLGDFLHEAGFLVEIEPDSLRGIGRTQTEPYDLLILDVMLPGTDGFEVLRQIRRRSQLPVLMLTAKTEPGERVRGFDLGADDYLPKPFYPEELLARVRAILRRVAHATADAPEVLQVGDLKLLPGTLEAFFQDQSLGLTAMECEVLEHLMRSCGRVVSRDDFSVLLYKRAATAFDRAVDVHVSRIRRKLGAARSLILSVRGTGYQLRHELDQEKP